MSTKLTEEQKTFIENHINETAKEAAKKKKKSGFWGKMCGFLVMAGKAYWEYEKLKKK
ncbi:hypothetical protein LCGC14_1759060 [marine sediment metagenome]|uniref:Uncharacterized protein n=1 Tax=marine sediment metagenome TaxID=412755 RepID=A0A0F9H1N5_9ZZZZ